MSKPNMQTYRADLASYLDVCRPSQLWVRDRLLEIFATGSGFPPFSAAVLKLARLAQDDDVGMDELTDLISKEPGLAANCLHAASTSRYGLGLVHSIRDAGLRMGTQEIRRMATSVGVMQGFHHLRVKVDWQRFWLHNLLVARLCDQIASAFRQSSGMEYLAGLLHDSGKMLIEHHFPQDFENILQRAWMAKRGHFIAEREILGLDHAQIGAAL